MKLLRSSWKLLCLACEGTKLEKISSEIAPDRRLHQRDADMICNAGSAHFTEAESTMTDEYIEGPLLNCFFFVSNNVRIINFFFAESSNYSTSCHDTSGKAIHDG